MSVGRAVRILPCSCACLVLMEVGTMDVELLRCFYADGVVLERLTGVLIASLSALFGCLTY